MRRWLPWLAAFVVVLGFLNFFWFLSESGSGGRPAPGIDPEWFRWHGVSVWVTHPLAMLAGAFLLFTVFFPDLIRGGRQAPSGAPVASIEASGELIAGRRVAGRLGGLRLSGPILDVTVYPGGIVFKPPFMAAIAIPADTIDGTTADRSAAGLGSRRLWIAHHEPSAPSPIFLYVGPDDPIAVAIGEVTGEAVADPRTQSPAVASREAIEKYPPLMKAMIIVGIALSPLIFIVGDQAVFHGRHTPFELVWLAVGVAIIATNVYRYVIRDRNRW